MGITDIVVSDDDANEQITATLTLADPDAGLLITTGGGAYTPETGFLDSVALEWEYESLEEYERDWAEWAATPESAAIQERLYDLTEIGGTSEFWRLEE